MSSQRRRPNILVTGTPGTGKTTLASTLAERTGFTHICVGELVKSQGLHDGYDAEFDTYIMNEDKICDALEDTVEEGGVIVDYHTVDFFPQRWFDLVVVLRTENDILYPRLENRGYNTNKIQENVSAEIMQVVLDEAMDSYEPSIVQELQSNTAEDLERNCQTVIAWLRGKC
eukprot:TRINITY_DN3314_c0_g1_i1.p1 TRINITY_DN3314_c0_g1~~TRINITY_DN3314_c0_g1_i1.p1  ORF type:complete len:172 (-),score=51.21 TRINITY_DN3314_c0_g1_i1:48-563(-)